MKQSSKRLTSIVLSLLLVVASLLIFFDLIQPAYGEIQTLKADTAGKQAFLDSETVAVQKAQQLIGDYQNQGTTAQNVSLALPPDQDIAGALAQVYGLAENDGVAIQTIAVTPGTLTPQTQGAAVGSGSIMKPTGIFSLQMTAAGSYENVKNYISGLETNARLLDVKGFTLSPAPAQTVATGKGAPVTSSDFFNYNIAVAAYYQAN